MEPEPCVTLLTDYGYEAGFVGALHAVAFRLAPHACVIDLDHSIPAGNVRLGALRLERLARYLPVGAHVAVVDPGVGGTRRPVALRAGPHRFVGPDNGLLVWGAEAAGGIEEAVVLDRDGLFLEGRARTFDGRDVFVPVAARLAGGGALGEVGSPIDADSLVRLERPQVRRMAEDAVEIEVVQVDGFGNVQFGADASLPAALGIELGDRVVLVARSEVLVATYGTTFGDVPPGAAVLLLDSDRQFALSLNGARADAALPVSPGDFVVLRREP